MENKGVLLTYHYREVKPDMREDLVPRAKEIITQCGFKVGMSRPALLMF